MCPKLEVVGFEWATFKFAENERQSLKEAQGDPKVASDQRSHALGVSLEVYTSSDMDQKRAAVRKLEAEVLRNHNPKVSPRKRIWLDGVNGISRDQWIFLSY